jgi:uncharacterized protein YbjT (DUF2867 family)
MFFIAGITGNIGGAAAEMLLAEGKQVRAIAAQLGKAIWGVLDPSWTFKENGSGVEAPKPLYLN